MSLSVMSIARSGMQAADQRLQVAGHNIANAATGGFRRQGVAQEAAPNGGVDTTVVRAPTPGPALEHDAVDLLAGKNAFLANLAVFRASDAMSGALLDTKA